MTLLKIMQRLAIAEALANMTEAESISGLQTQTNTIDPSHTEQCEVESRQVRRARQRKERK